MDAIIDNMINHSCVVVISSTWNRPRDISDATNWVTEVMASNPASNQTSRI